MATNSKEKTGVVAKLDSYFMITQRGSTLGREIRGGLTTFFTMAYIVVINPLILGTVADVDGKYIGGVDTPEQAILLVAAATALVAGLMSILMGVWAKFPIAIAAGMGINAFLAFGVVIGKGVTWPQAMGFVVIEGLVVLVLVLTKFRMAVFRAIPLFLKKSIAVGIGLFLALVGLVNAGVVNRNGGTALQFGNDSSINTYPMLVFVIGLLVAFALYARKVKGALLISIAVTTVLSLIIEKIFDLGSTQTNASGWQNVVPTIPDKIVDTPDLSAVGQVDIWGALTSLPVLTVLLVIFSLLITDFFDTMGTMTAVGEEAGLNDEEGTPANSQEILIVDSIAAAAGGLASTSSNTSYIESASGVGEGARTGLASVVTGVAFLLATFLTPLYSIVPAEAAAPVLVVVGYLMVTQVAEIDWTDFRIAVPAFITFILMPFGYSISVGIGAGFITYVVLSAATGHIKKIHPLMWGAAAAFVLYFALGPINALIS